MSAGARYMVLSALAFSVMSALVKLAGERLPSQELVLARALVTLILTIGLLRAARASLWGTRGRRGLLFFRGVLGFLGLSCVYYAVTALPLAEATVLQYLHPLFTALLAAVFLREKLTPKVLLSCAISLVGVILITRPAFVFGGAASSLPTLGVLVAIAGSFLSASAYVVVRRLSTTEHPLVIVFYFPLIAVPLSLPTVAPMLVWPEGVEWLWIVGLGIAAQLGQVWLTRGLERERAGRATAMSYLQVAFAATFGIVVFDEVPTPWTIAGALAILAGTLVAALGKDGGAKEERPPTSASGTSGGAN